MVHRMMLVKVGSRYVHLLKMFGALFTFACAFFVLNASYELSLAMQAAGSDYQLAQALRSSGVEVRAGSPGDVFGTLTAPIGSLFLWLSLMVIGLALYRSDRTIFPLEEDIRDYPELSQGSARRMRR